MIVFEDMGNVAGGTKSLFYKSQSRKELGKEHDATGKISCIYEALKVRQSWKLGC